MPQADKEKRFQVQLMLFNVPGNAGHIYTEESVKGALKSSMMQRIRNKAFYGEFGSPNPSLGIVRCTEVALENICLRLTDIGVDADGLKGHIVAAGPRKEEMLQIISKYQQPIPLAMRAMVKAVDGDNIAVIEDFVSFDFSAELMQNHPKLGEPAPKKMSRPAGISVGEPNGRPPKVENTDKIADVDPTVVGKAATSDSVVIGDTVDPIDEQDLLEAFNIFFDALSDEDVIAVVGDTVSATELTTVRSITFKVQIPDRQIPSIWMLNHHIGEDRLTMSQEIGSNGIASSDLTRVKEAFAKLVECYETATANYIANQKECTTVADTSAKKTAKQVFKSIKPIESKNVTAYYDQVFRVRPNTKFDGYMKQLSGKSGVFVRVGDDSDVYVLPYVITSDDKTAGERSLRGALKTRGLTVVDTDDLK